MREKIATEIKWSNLFDISYDQALVFAGKILSFISEEIEKVENPLTEYNKEIGTQVRSYIRRCYEYYQVGNLPTSIYEDIVKTSGVIQLDTERMLYDNAFEGCRQKILSLLKE